MIVTVVFLYNYKCILNQLDTKRGGRMQGRTDNFVRREVFVNRVWVDLIFDPNAFTLLGISSNKTTAFNTAADEFCRFAAAHLQNQNRDKEYGFSYTHKYYIHKAYADSKDYHFVCSNLNAASTACTKEQVKNYASQINNYQFIETHNVDCNNIDLTAAQDFISALEQKAKEDFLNGNTQAKPTPTADELKQSQEENVQKEKAAQLGLEDARAAVSKHIEHASKIIENYHALIKQTQTEIAAKLEGYIRSVPQAQKKEQQEFYSLQVQANRELELKSLELAADNATILGKTSELETSITANSKQTEAKIRDALDTKVAYLQALHKSAADIYNEQIAKSSREKKEGLRDRFNKFFFGIAEIDAFGCLSYHTDCLQMSLDSFVTHCNNILNQTHNTQATKLFTSDPFKDDVYKAILFNLQLTSSATGKRITLQEQIVGAASLQVVSQFAAEFKQTIDSEKAALDKSVTALTQTSPKTDEIAESCQRAKAQSQQVLDSLPAYSQFIQYATAIKSLAKMLEDHLANLEEIQSKLSGNIKDDPKANDLFTLNMRIKTDIEEIKALREELAKKAQELAIESPITYINIATNLKKARNMVTEYKDKLRLGLLRAAAPGTVLETAQLKFEESKKKNLNDFLAIHPKFTEYCTLRQKGIEVKKALAQIDTPEKHAELQTTVNLIYKFSANLAPPVNSEKKANLYDPDNMVITIRQTHTAAKENLAARNNDLQAARSSAALIPDEIPAQLSIDNIDEATSQLSKAINQAASSLTSAKTNAEKITDNLKKQRQDYYPLITKNFNLMKFCQALVDMILDNEFWSTQVTVGGTRSPYLNKQDREVNVPSGVAKMQLKIKNHFNVKPNTPNFLDGEPLAAIELLKALKQCAHAGSRNCGVGFFKNLAFRTATTSNLYQYLNNLDIDTIFNDRNVIIKMNDAPHFTSDEKSNSETALNDNYIHGTIETMKNSIGYREQRLQPIQPI